MWRKIEKNIAKIRNRIRRLIDSTYERKGIYMDQTYMKEQPILKLIVSMALPMVISMMVSSLYNIVDSFFIARISEDAMTALSLVYPV